MIGEAVRENYRRQGEYRERERIIKLLTDIAVVTKNDEIAVMELLSAIIELIKRENK